MFEFIGRMVTVVFVLALIVVNGINAFCFTVLGVGYSFVMTEAQRLTFAENCAKHADVVAFGFVVAGITFIFMVFWLLAQLEKIWPQDKE